MGYHSERGFQGAGGTTGGVSEFVSGLAMALVGGYMILQRIHVSSGFQLPYWFGHHSSFGTVFSLFLVGVFILFVNGGSKLGWALTAGGIFLIFFGVVNSLHVYFTHTTLLNTLIMFGLFAGGMGLIAKSLRPH
jgi:hypothetical protein